MTERNRTVRLARRPHGAVTRDEFTIEDEARPVPGDGEILVRVRFISIDPAMRGWMNEGRSYVPPVALGDVMRALAVGEVVESNHDGFSPGDAVTGLFGVQRYAVSDGRDVQKVDAGRASLPCWVGGLGMPGMTAYFGLTDVGRPKKGETVVVSAASGAVGSLVGQIAKILGCRAVGIAGGEEKCRYLTDELGFDAAVDYKAGRLQADLVAATPDGIDVYFENVGGVVLEAVLDRMNTFGRIPVCGLISMYNATEPQPGPRNLRSILVNRLRMQGFIVFDYRDRYREGVEALLSWHEAGLLIFREDVRPGGVDAYPDVLNLLFSGGNFGKLVLEV